MPKARKKNKKAKQVPSYGRSEKDVRKDIGLRKVSGNVPLGNNNPTMVQGVLYGGMPSGSGAARGGLRTYRGKRGV